MKRRFLAPVSKKFATRVILVVVALLLTVSIPLAISPKAFADKYDDQIAALKREIALYQEQADRLASEANTLQREVSKLAGEKAVIQGQIDISEAKFAQLQQQIKETEQKIVDNKDALGTTLADLYVDDKISPLEMLASSNNIGDYVDKQTYRSSIQDSLASAIDTIKKLKAELEKQKAEVERVLADQKNQRQALASKEAERQDLLNKTRGEEAVYQQISSAKNAEVDRLRAQQAAEIRARASSSGYRTLPGDPNRGGYPAAWMSASMSSCSADPWGMCKRQCVSYAAFKVDQTYGNMPYWGGIGNANQWANNARAAGIRVESYPAERTVGVQYSGYYGHVAWIESVNSDGTLTISQFNAYWSGEYSRWVVDRSFFNEYVYFGG